MGDSPFVTFEGKDWYRTGDLVSADAGGRITFQGRLKRFIKLGGEMVSLPAIEAVLQPHFGEADDGPIVAVEAVGSAEQPDIVLFTRKPADRAEIGRAANAFKDGIAALIKARLAGLAQAGGGTSRPAFDGTVPGTWRGPGR